MLQILIPLNSALSWLIWLSAPIFIVQAISFGQFCMKNPKSAPFHRGMALWTAALFVPPCLDLIGFVGLIPTTINPAMPFDEQLGIWPYQWFFLHLLAIAVAILPWAVARRPSFALLTIRGRRQQSGRGAR
jgi:hypothetical protein